MNHVLLTRLSFWFRISVLNWFKSYLSSRFFRVRCNNTFMSLCTSSVVFPKALFSVLYDFHHVHYPSVLSSHPFPLTPPFCRQHRTIFLILPPNFDSSIIYLQNALKQISSWMTANLLTLNSSKIEFLLIGLKRQLDKIHNSSLNTTRSARNLGFIFDEHLTFSDQISAISKACYYHIRQLRCIRPYLDCTTACTTATSIVHFKLDYCNSLYYNLPKSPITRFQQIQNSLARAVKAPKSCHITPILRSLRWLKITKRSEYSRSVTKSSQLPNLHISTTSSLFNLLAALTLHLWLPSLDHQRRPHYI